MSTTKVTYSMIEGAPVNVKDFGAVGDGVTDDTAAFTDAIATGKKVFVPYTTQGYVVNDIDVVTNMVVEGEKSGISNGPKLIVTTNNAGAFTHSDASSLYQIEIRNFVIEAASGVTGARAYKQNDKSVYTAYCVFENIETSSTLLKSYDGFFIFTKWKGCRDGYIGTTGAQGHGWIDCIPSSWNQSNKANLNSIEKSYCFEAVAGTTGIVAAVDIGYGVNWSFDGCDFEDITLQAIRTRGIFNISFSNCWLERITADRVATFDVSSTPDGSRPVSFNNCTFDLYNTTAYCIVLGAASFVSFNNCGFIQVGTGVVLTNSNTAVCGANNLQIFSGAGAAGFLTGFNTTQYSAGITLLNGATDNGSGAPVQLSGLFSSTGYTSSRNINVSTTAVAIASYSFVGGLAFINGYNTSGGNSGWWLVGFKNTGATVLSSNDSTATTPIFTVVSGVLKMATTTGTLAISTALLV